ncbi:YlzJ-like family protein [Oceanobacillus massiliensis]|uniref:YlzJ-like family protein n=1 Tax=Oceanobacillus massiliensis TaxID=1465765 RepID=UPI000289867B|nr:YlzJ-like family protein [Oceanobacillus massiliensis]
MILYTPLAHNDIFPVEMDAYASMESVFYKGRTLFALRKQDGSYQIQQLLSTDPQDYLNSEFAPGRILS